MKTFRFSLVLSLLLLSAAAFAEDAAMLLPIGPSSINGAFGSRWHTMLFVWNGAKDPAALVCPPEACRTVPAEREAIFQANGGANAGIVYVPAASADSVEMALRTVVSTNDTQTAVIEIPVVPLSRFRADHIRILGIPLGHGYRQSLRIYDAEGRDGAQVRIQVFAGEGDTPMTYDVTLHVEGVQSSDTRVVRPATAQLNLLETFAPLFSADFATVVLTPLTPGSRIWAFATSTNNVTQQVNNFVP